MGLGLGLGLGLGFGGKRPHATFVAKSISLSSCRLHVARIG